MGWANWNFYFCDYNEQTIRDQADALVSNGMRDLGYRYVIIQECIASVRDREGRLVPDAERFPHGIPALVEYLHQRGLKAGIYTDVGPFTCFPSPRYQGSYEHERVDAQTFAAWGIDLVEVDYCNKPEHQTGRELYGRMAAAIRDAGRPMLLYICSWGEEQPWEWANGMAQLWRTGPDISYEKGQVKWESIVRNFELNANHAAFTAPESWNDPDMLEVGNRGISMTESRSHFSMWAISAAPLWAGTDLTSLNQETLATFTNPEVIAVDQDALGAGVRRVGGGRQVQVWSKALGKSSGESQAVLLLNLASSRKKAAVRCSDLGLRPGASVRDLWTHKELGSLKRSYSTELPPHGSVLLRVDGIPLRKFHVQVGRNGCCN
jgi:alpha-galactosidase